MASMVALVREVWRKNWPELHAALTGGVPGFVFAPSPSTQVGPAPVFCYHVVSVERLRRDLRFLSSNGYVTIDADAVLRGLSDPESYPERAVVLTVDDGARNLYDVVYPLLASFGMQAVAFVCPGLHRAESSYTLSDGEAREDLPCSWEQIDEMHASGVIDFQSHTFEHRYVPRWPEPAGLTGCGSDVVDRLRGAPLPIAEDFRRAKAMLEDRLDKLVRHLAFPKFFGTEAAIAEGRECGYEAFWWGALPGRRGRPSGIRPTHIPRLNDEWLRRLPGEGRSSLGSVLRGRYGGTLERLVRWADVRGSS